MIYSLHTELTQILKYSLDTELTYILAYIRAYVDINVQPTYRAYIHISLHTELTYILMYSINKELTYILQMQSQHTEFIHSIGTVKEIDVKLCQNFTKTYIHKIWYFNQSLKQIIFSTYETNLKTTISQSFFLLLFEYNNFSFLIDIIDTSVSRQQNSHHQWQCSIHVT